MARVETWIHESNLIEGINNPIQDDLSQLAWKAFLRKRKLNVDNILKLHKTIMYMQRKDIAGKFRDCNVRVGSYIAPDYIEVLKLMYGWCAEYEHASNSLDITKAHVAFEKIHPFEDGNGRVGRMIMNWQLVKNECPPICINFSDRFLYYGWFV